MLVLSSGIDIRQRLTRVVVTVFQRCLGSASAELSTQKRNGKLCIILGVQLQINHVKVGGAD